MYNIKKQICMHMLPDTGMYLVNTGTFYFPILAGIKDSFWCYYMSEYSILRPTGTYKLSSLR